MLLELTARPSTITMHNAMVSWSCMTSNSNNFPSTLDVVSPISESRFCAKQLLLVCRVVCMVWFKYLIEILLCSCVIVFQHRTYINLAVILLGITFHRHKLPKWFWKVWQCPFKTWVTLSIVCSADHLIKVGRVLRYTCLITSVIQSILVVHLCASSYWSTSIC